MPVPVDIVLPCYNPNDSWYKELISFYDHAKERYLLNFILVNDGSVASPVKSQVELLQQQQIPVTYISYSKNQGKGHALRQGVAASQNSFVMYTDVDFPFTASSMIAVLDSITSGTCDIAAGYRNENYYAKTMSFYRKLLSKSFRFFIKKILGMATSDTQCGLKAFNQKGRQVFLATRINRYLFDFEFIYTGSKNKSIRIKTVEVQLKDNIVFSSMKLKVLLQESINLVSILLFRRR